MRHRLVLLRNITEESKRQGGNASEILWQRIIVSWEVIFQYPTTRTDGRIGAVTGFTLRISSGKTSPISVPRTKVLCVHDIPNPDRSQL